MTPCVVSATSSSASTRRNEAFAAFGPKRQFKDHRDKLGGHVQWQALHGGLPHVIENDAVDWQVSEDAIGTHYWFAAQLAAVGFLRQVPNDDWTAEHKALVRKVSELTRAVVEAIDWIFLTYLKARGLWPEAPLASVVPATE